MGAEIGAGLVVGEVVGVGVEGGVAMTDEQHHGGCRGVLAGDGSLSGTSQIHEYEEMT